MKLKAAILGTQQTGDDARDILRQAAEKAIFAPYMPKEKVPLANEPEPLELNIAQNRGIKDRVAAICVERIAERRWLYRLGYGEIALPEIGFYQWRR